MRIDFHARKTELGWSHAVDKFILSIVPEWFQIIEWALVIGALKAIEPKQKQPIGFVIVMSYFALWAYIQVRFASNEVFLFRRLWIDRILGAVVGVFMVYGLYVLIESILKAFDLN